VKLEHDLRAPYRLAGLSSITKPVLLSSTLVSSKAPITTGMRYNNWNRALRSKLDNSNTVSLTNSRLLLLILLSSLTTATANMDGGERTHSPEKRARCNTAPYYSRRPLYDHRTGAAIIDTRLTKSRKTLLTTKTQRLGDVYQELHRRD
jgi:hypothetical protein